MPTGKRASMREGPLAARVRKTAEDTAHPAPPESPPAAEQTGQPAAPPEHHIPSPQERLRHAFSADIPENLNPAVDIEGILPTLVDTRTLHAKEAIELLEENFGDRVFASRIRKTVRFAEAPVKGMSVLKYDPDGLAAHAYRQLAKEVLSNANR